MGLLLPGGGTWRQGDTLPRCFLKSALPAGIALASPNPEAHLAPDCRRALPPGIPGHRTSRDRYRHAGLGGLGRDAATQPCRPCPPPPGSPQPASQHTAHTASSRRRRKGRTDRRRTWGCYEMRTCSLTQLAHPPEAVLDRAAETCRWESRKRGNEKDVSIRPRHREPH